MMLKNKKAQFLILSGMILMGALIFIYSLETENNYILKDSENSMLNNIEIETCHIGKLSNGTYIESRYSNFSKDVKEYCGSFNYSCILNITNKDGETNLSRLNYKNFSYNIKLTNNNSFSYDENFTC